MQTGVREFAEVYSRCSSIELRQPGSRALTHFTSLLPICHVRDLSPHQPLHTPQCVIRCVMRSELCERQREKVNVRIGTSTRIIPHNKF